MSEPTFIPAKVIAARKLAQEPDSPKAINLVRAIELLAEKYPKAFQNLNKLKG